MALFGWFKRQDSGPSEAVRQWRAAWARAIDGSADTDAALRRQLERLGESEPDVELELEMFDALESLRAVEHQLAAGSLPTVETHHRVIGTDPCHFTAPASLPADPAQAAGRLLLTPRRAVFVGGGRNSATPWHAVRQVARADRDVLLVGGDRTAAAHYRFNTYADAIVCALLARHLGPGRGKSL